MKQEVSKSFSVVKQLENVYQGGQVEWVGGNALVLTGGGVCLVKEGALTVRLAELEDPTVCFTSHSALVPTSDSFTVVTAHRSGLVRMWDVKPAEEKAVVTRTVRSHHTGPMACLRVGRAGTGPEHSLVACSQNFHTGLTS